MKTTDNAALFISDLESRLNEYINRTYKTELGENRSIFEETNEVELSNKKYMSKVSINRDRNEEEKNLHPIQRREFPDIAVYLDQKNIMPPGLSRDVEELSVSFWIKEQDGEQAPKNISHLTFYYARELGQEKFIPWKVSYMDGSSVFTEKFLHMRGDGSFAFPHQNYLGNLKRDFSLHDNYRKEFAEKLNQRFNAGLGKTVPMLAYAQMAAEKYFSIVP